MLVVFPLRSVAVTVNVCGPSVLVSTRAPLGWPGPPSDLPRQLAVASGLRMEVLKEAA